MASMGTSRPQFTIRHMLIAIALLSAALFVGMHTARDGTSPGELLCSVLIGGSFGVLRHRFWRGVALGSLAAGNFYCYVFLRDFPAVGC
jgi:hypothetical protein